MGTTDRTSAERQKRLRQRKKVQLDDLTLFASGIFQQVDTGVSDEVLGRFCRVLVEGYRPIISHYLDLDPVDPLENLGGSGGDSPPV